jgi:hypothetical protein
MSSLQIAWESVRSFFGQATELAVQVLGWLGIAGTVILWLAGFLIGRALLLQLLRICGLYNPDHYRFFPRVPWRFAFPLFLRLDHWLADFAMGKKQNAKWAGPLERMAMMYKPGMLLLGRLRVLNIGWLMPVGMRTRRHLVMVATTGAGKTTSVISMLALHRGNSFVIDPKGQIAAALLDRMGGGGTGIIGKGRKALTLDPNRVVSDHPSACWNPFDELHQIEEREGREAVPEVAAKMAEALIQQDGQSQPIFANAAREFVKALVLHIYSREERGNQTLMTLRRMLCQGIQDTDQDGSLPLTPIQNLLMQMDFNRSFEAIGNAIGTVRDALKKQNEGSFLSSAKVQLGWIDFDSIAAISGRSDFSLFDLKDGDLNLFIVGKPSDVRETYTGWFRLLTVMGMQAFERSTNRPAHPTMFVIDEMPSLGYIEVLEKAAPVMRGYGVQLLAITQDLALLQKAYPDGWSTFIGNADAVFWMATNHSESLRYLQQELGGRTSKDGEDRPIAYGEQLRRFLEPERGNIIVTRNGARPLRLKVPHYFRELPVYYYQTDPNERETIARAKARDILQTLIPEDDVGEPPEKLGLIWFVSAMAVAIFVAAIVVGNGTRLVASRVDAGLLRDFVGHGVSVAALGYLWTVLSASVAPFAVRTMKWTCFALLACMFALGCLGAAAAGLHRIGVNVLGGLAADWQRDPLNSLWSLLAFGLSSVLVSLTPPGRLQMFRIWYPPVLRGWGVLDPGDPARMAPPARQQHLAKHEGRADFGDPEGRPVQLNAPFSLVTARGTFRSNGDGTITHLESGVMFIGGPWGAEFINGQFQGDAIKLNWYDATKLFGRGVDAPVSSSILVGEKLDAAARSSGYTTGRTTVRFAGYGDWSLPTADELDLLGMYRKRAGYYLDNHPLDDWSGDGISTISCAVRARLFPWFHDHPAWIWSATGVSGGLAWATDGRWPLGDHHKHLAAAGIFLVRSTEPVAEHDDYEDFAIAVPMMPPGMRRVLCTHYEIADLKITLGRGVPGTRVAEGERILEYWTQRFDAPCAGRVRCVSKEAFRPADDTEAPWPQNVGVLYTIQPVRGQDLSGVMQRAWEHGIEWYERVITNRDHLLKTPELAQLVEFIEGNRKDLERLMTLPIQKVAPDWSDSPAPSSVL